MNPNKALWEKGDFTHIAECMRDSGEALAGTLNVAPGLKAARKDGRDEALLAELNALFSSQNRSAEPGATSIPATFLRVTVTVA